MFLNALLSSVYFTFKYTPPYILKGKSKLGGLPVFSGIVMKYTY